MAACSLLAMLRHRFRQVHAALIVRHQDIYYLYHGLLAHYQNNDNTGLDTYSEKALARVWKAQRFSWWMTTMLHTFPESNFYDRNYNKPTLNICSHPKWLRERWRRTTSDYRSSTR
jgi:2-polyprenyl-6-methoxyphenol hydroxylase-like FAD-dependent oxidoreductase